MAREKYSRATGVVVRDGKVLLVRERRNKDFSLPGGRIHAGEASSTAVTREIYEEVGLSVKSLVFAGSHEGRFVTHQVYVLDTTGEVRLRRREIERYAWWDGTGDLPVQDHVKAIIELCAKAEGSGALLPNLGLTPNSGQGGTSITRR